MCRLLFDPRAVWDEGEKIEHAEIEAPHRMNQPRRVQAMLEMTAVVTTQHADQLCSASVLLEHCRRALPAKLLQLLLPWLLALLREPAD
tara:strand:- start:756 stop:1022 length:267 start_codon:yes stop_codon:yes gene_type:complete